MRQPFARGKNANFAPSPHGEEVRKLEDCSLQRFPCGKRGNRPNLSRGLLRETLGVSRHTSGRLTHTTPVTGQGASLMCDEEYGPTQAPLWAMLRNGTVTSSREDVGPKK